jgi:transcriptional regulator with XRE-family HTH domain
MLMITYPYHGGMMPPREFPTMASNLRALRDAAGLSQQELATRSGLSVSVVFQMEQGRKKDSKLSTLVCLAEGLRMELGRFVTELVREGRPRGRRK